MLRKQDMTNRDQLVFFSIDELVPKDHLLRKIDAVMNFDFIYELVSEMYSEDKGRPSIDPVVLIKLVFIQYLFGIGSMRKTIREVNMNIAYRWFLGYGIKDEIPHFSTFSKNYARRFKNSNVFEEIFAKILSEAVEAGFVDPKEVFIDSTHIKASANKKKTYKEEVVKEAKIYRQLLDEEIEKSRAIHGQKPFKKKQNQETKLITKSIVDPDCGMFHKGEKERVLAYSVHAACDKKGFVLSSIVSAANVHDSVVFKELYENVKSKFTEISAVAVDSGYKTPYICKILLDDNVTPVMPYKRPMTKKGFFKKHDFVYDEYYDCYICPKEEILTYSTTNREGYKEYVSNPQVCLKCEFLHKCTCSKNNKKVVCRHVWEEYLEEAEHLRHTTYNKSIYALRSQTIERVFADLKEKHGLRYTTLRGIDKVRMQTLLAFACLNLKKLANWKWKNSKNQLIFSIFLSIKYVFSKLRDKSYARLKICPFGQIVLSTNWNLDNYLSSFFVVD